jgi:hypothetical protein
MGATLGTNQPMASTRFAEPCNAARSQGCTTSNMCAMEWSYSDDLPAGAPSPPHGVVDSEFGRRIQKMGPGYVFGERFHILSELGRGGMGVVYRARERGSGRDVALKILSKSANPGALKRFTREGEVTAALRHPGIVGIHSGGELEGLPYLAYELIPESRTIHDVFREVDLEARAWLVHQVCGAVGFAHSRGVLHRDLKPDNILVAPDGSPRVADFGLAGGEDLERLTLTGVLIGTPSYMAPEQITGQRDQGGAHTDVWALGVILYEALTGELPFQAESLLNLATVIMRDEPVPLRRKNPQVSPALEAVCLQALRRKPEERYPDAMALGEDIAAALRGGPIRASSTTAFGHWAAVALRRGKLPLILSLILAVFASLGALAFVATRPSPKSAPVPTPSVEATPEVDRAARTLDALLQDRSDERARLLAFEAWLAAHSEHGRFAEARAATAALANETTIRSFPIPHVERVGFLDDERLFAVGARPTQVRIWRLDQPGEEPVWERKLPGFPYQAAWAPGGLVAIATGRGYLGQIQALKLMRIPGGARAVTFDARAERVAFGGEQHAFIYRVSDRKELWRAEAPRKRVHSLAFSPDGKRLAAAVGDRDHGSAAVCVWDLEKGSLEVIAQSYEEPLLLFSPKGDKLLCGDRSGTLWIHDGFTGQRERSVEGRIQEYVKLAQNLAHMGDIRRMLFLPDGRLLTCSQGSRRSAYKLASVALWSPDWAEVGRVLVQPVRWQGCDLSPNGKRLALARGSEIEIRSAWVLEARSSASPRKR